MKKPFLTLKGSIAAAAVAIGLASVLGQQPSLADTGRSILQDLDPQRNTNDPLAPNSNEVDNMGVFDLIHRFNQGSSVWNSEQQNQQLNDAAAEFRAKQQQLLQQQGQQIQTPPASQVVRPQKP
ncbi:hypothetical protein NUACC21_01480 [Scytonema sp. NUACC21]